MKKLFLLLVILSLFAFQAHKYYVALTEIEYNSKNESLEIIISLFIDDFEEVINEDYNINAQLYSEKEITNVDKYFEEYIVSHFKVKVNNNDLNYEYIGKEYEGQNVFIYLEIKNTKNISSLEIYNDMLIEYFPKQQNLIKVKINNERKSLFLSENDKSGLLNF